MTKGITKSCPNVGCRKILIRHCNFKGCGKFQMKCNNCKELIEITLTEKAKVTASKILKVLCFILLLIGLFFSIQPKRVEYAEYIEIPNTVEYVTLQVDQQ